MFHAVLPFCCENLTNSIVTNVRGDNNDVMLLRQVRHMTVLKGLTCSLSEGSMRSSSGSLSPPGIYRCPPVCDVVEPVANRVLSTLHLVSHVSSFTSCTPHLPLLVDFCLPQGEV